ncbi:PAS domain-containing sensor histidine kinase [Trichlorobacter lovleyi]|uniref:PAS domain-containing sensor histidine kinase n=1 Tax=Trichlorobacter lovleyi TaxID=313985 RepID=UPI0023F37ACD|nr:PAS domain-containing sensor histidine kinase [Trichlorobacter lovleyi]
MSGCPKQQENCLAYVRYIREKTNQLLGVMGTEPLQEEELDDHALIELDPIGTIAQSFGHILEYLNETINELQVAKDELQAIFDATGVGISIIDRNFRILRCNEKQRTLLLAPEAEDVTGCYCFDAYGNRNAPVEHCPAKYTFATGQPAVAREIVKRGKYFQVATTPFARDENNKVTTVIEVSLDITEKKMAEQSEKEQRDFYLTEKSKLATVLESLSEGLLVAGTNDRILSVNRSATMILQRDEAELIGLALTDLFPVISVELTDPMEIIQGLELTCTQARANECHLSLNMAPLLDNEMKRIGRVITFRNITEEKKQQELYHRTEKLSAIGQLSAGVAHELNTPLGSILGYARLLLKQENLTQQQREQLAVIAEQAKKSGTIIQALLNFSRHAQPTQCRLDACDLNSVIKNALCLLTTELSKRKIILTTDLELIPKVCADPWGIEQVVLNLVMNALQAIGSQGEIRIIVRRQPGGVRLEVQDSGPGIPDEVRSRIFDPFFTTKPFGEGTGLGLSICAGIVNENGGNIDIVKSDSRGTTFVVILPCKESVDA